MSVWWPRTSETHRFCVPTDRPFCCPSLPLPRLLQGLSSAFNWLPSASQSQTAVGGATSCEIAWPQRHLVTIGSEPFWSSHLLVFGTLSEPFGLFFAVVKIVSPFLLSHRPSKSLVTPNWWVFWFGNSWLKWSCFNLKSKRAWEGFLCWDSILLLSCVDESSFDKDLLKIRFVVINRYKAIFFVQKENAF